MRKILIAALGMLLGSTGAWALTQAGSNIANSASLTYSAGGVDQTDAAHGGPKISNTDTFIVDKKVDFTLTNDDGDQITSNVVPGAQDINTTWTLTNTGNMDQNFTLASINLTNNESIYGDPDTAGVDTGTQEIWVSADAGASWALYPANTVIELDGDYPGNTPAHTSVLVRVASDIPNTVVNGNVMNIQLTAKATYSDGAIQEEENAAGHGDANGADRPGDMDTILAEELGIDPNDAVVNPEGNVERDATIKKWGGYKVATAVLDVTKESCVLWDPANKAAAPKRIPGAVIRYAIDINNTGSADAESVVLTDAVPTNTTYGVGISGLTQTARIVTETCNCANPGASNGDAISEAGGTVTANYATVTQGTHECAYFDVTID